MANTINTPVSSKQRVEKRGGGANTPWLEATAPQSPPLSLHTVWLPRCLLLHSLNHTKSLCLAKKREEKRDYDTWCSQVVSNPSTNQARRGLTSLIRREVVLSSWYGRNSFSASDWCASGSEAADSVPATQSQRERWGLSRSCLKPGRVE